MRGVEFASPEEVTPEMLIAVVHRAGNILYRAYLLVTYESYYLSSSMQLDNRVLALTCAIGRNVTLACLVMNSHVITENVMKSNVQSDICVE